MQVRALKPHTHLGRSYKAGAVYKRMLRLAVQALARGEVELVEAAQHDWWGAQGRILQAVGGEATVFASGPQEGALRILQGTGYDPGNAAYRYHSAVNEASIHASAFLRWGDTNATCSLRQLDLRRDWARARGAFESADVLHCHVDYRLFTELGYPKERRAGVIIVRHYHGSKMTGTPHPVLGAEDDDRLDAVIVGARLRLLTHREAGRMHWLPIPMPVARYAALREEYLAETAGVTRPFRIGHSPTVRAIKGTEVFLRVMRSLRARGLDVEPVLIEGLQHGEALKLKATCDATFDSFWLGMQGSGLEGGAMALPCIAGDVDARDDYLRALDACPYTFAPDERSLSMQIERLVTDPIFYATESERVFTYVRRYHDYPSVAMRYDSILQARLHKESLSTPY